jgi:hypothetical protein
MAAVLVAGACIGWALDNHLTALIDGITPMVSTFGRAPSQAASISPRHGYRATIGNTAGDRGGAAHRTLAYGVSIVLYIRAAQQLGAVRSQAIFASAPFIGAALSYGLLGDPLAPSAMIAAALMVGSACLLFDGTHAHPHRHPVVVHTHSHRHDDAHHDHDHPNLPDGARHTHEHRHDERVHAHPHWPDLHHRHGHERR